MQFRHLHFATKLAFLLVAALATSVAVRAESGTLGRRFGEFNFDVVDFSRRADNAYSTALSVNLPATANLDVGGTYAYGWLNGTGRSVDEHTLLASAKVHATASGPKPFVGAGFGCDWTRSKVGVVRMYDANAIWGAGVGVEMPLGAATSLTPSVSYNDTIRRRSIGAVVYAAELNHWLTSDVAGFAAVIHSDFTGSNGSNWVYRAGLRCSF